MAWTGAVGGCNCGAVRYVVNAEPLTAYICHCNLCQKRTGSAFSHSIVFPEDALTVTAGTPERTERALPNGRLNTSYVCGACLSRLWTHREGWPTVNVRAGTLDDTHDVRPVAQMWVSSAQPWAIVKDDILSFEEQPADFGLIVKAWANRG
jgi:hypothetical protein